MDIIKKRPIKLYSTNARGRYDEVVVGVKELLNGYGFSYDETVIVDLSEQEAKKLSNKCGLDTSDIMQYSKSSVVAGGRDIYETIAIRKDGNIVGSILVGQLKRRGRARYDVNQKVDVIVTYNEFGKFANNSSESFGVKLYVKQTSSSWLYSSDPKAIIRKWTNVSNEFKKTGDINGYGRQNLDVPYSQLSSDKNGTKMSMIGISKALQVIASAYAAEGKLEALVSGTNIRDTELFLGTNLLSYYDTKFGEDNYELNDLVFKIRDGSNSTDAKRSFQGFSSVTSNGINHNLYVRGMYDFSTNVIDSFKINFEKSSFVIGQEIIPEIKIEDFIGNLLKNQDECKALSDASESAVSFSRTDPSNTISNIYSKINQRRVSDDYGYHAAYITPTDISISLEVVSTKDVENHSKLVPAGTGVVYLYKINYTNTLDGTRHTIEDRTEQYDRWSGKTLFLTDGEFHIEFTSYGKDLDTWEETLETLAKF